MPILFLPLKLFQMKHRPKFDYNAPFCLSFALLSMLVYVMGLLSGGWVPERFFSLPGAASLAQWTTWPRLILHVLGHASAEHLFSNLVIFLLVGPLLEKMYGSRLLLLLSLLTAILTGLLMIVFFKGSLAGASGIVFAFIILSSFANAKSGTVPLTFILISVIFLGGEILRALSGEDQTARFAHIAGGLVGGIAGFLIARRTESAHD